MRSGYAHKWAAVCSFRKVHYSFPVGSMGRVTGSVRVARGVGEGVRVAVHVWMEGRALGPCGARERMVLARRW